VTENALVCRRPGLATRVHVLGILPCIEKAFSHHPSMTLLELADASHPLLRRLQIEAAGTYNHSLQVATLAEAAGRGHRRKLAAVPLGSSYHDSEDFTSPSTSRKTSAAAPTAISPHAQPRVAADHHRPRKRRRGDGHDYNLPKSSGAVHPRITGRRWVSIFTNQACKREQQHRDAPAVSESSTGTRGPKPRTKGRWRS